MLDGSVLLPPVAKQPSPIDSDEYAREAEPGEGVSQVIIGKGRMQPAGPRQAPGRVRAFQFEIKGRNAEAHGHCDRGGVAGKPDVAGWIACGREHARGLGPTQYADHVDRPRNRSVRTGGTIPLALWHKAAIDHHEGAACEPCGHKYPIARAAAPFPEGRPACEDKGFAVVKKFCRHGDMQELILRRREPGPCRWRRK